MTGDASRREEALSVFLSILMVGSVMAIGGAAFAGSAAAQEAGNGEVILLDGSGDQVDTYDSGTPLQDAYDNATQDYTILVGSGTFSAPDPQIDGLTIKGAGMDETTLETNQMNPDATNLTISDLEIDAGGAAIMVEDNMAADGLHIENVRVTSSDGTTTIAFQTVAKEDNVDKADGLHIENFVADNPSVKGLYLERAHNALLKNITVDGVQYTGNENPPSNGIDINLKYDDYENLTIEDTVVRGVEADDFDEDPTWNAAMAIKARDDGSYSSSPANLTDVTIDDVTIEESVAGLRFGEPGVDYSSDPEGPTDITIADSTFQNNENYHVEDLSGSVDLATVEGENTFDQSVVFKQRIHPSIQAAVDYAESGDTIEVDSGTYNESVSISTSNVTLESAAGADSPTINSTTLGRMNIQDAANNVTVEGFSFVFDNQAIYVRSDNVTIQDNTFELADDTESQGYAVRYEGLTSDGEVYGNTFTGISNTVADEFGNGVIISGPDGHEIADNTFTNNSIGVNVGSQQPAGTLQIANNTFTEQDNYAIALNHDDSGTPDFDITNNNIESNPIGIFVLSDGDIDVHDNNIVDSSNEGINATFLTNTQVNATNNWWGSSDGPSDDTVSDNVDVDPWLNAPLDEGGDVRIAATVDGEEFSSIGSAVDAAKESDVVEVGSGEFNESISIDTTNVTVRGSGNDTVLNGEININAQESTVSDLRVTSPSVFDTGEQDDGGNPVIYITASDAAVERITIDGITGDGTNSLDIIQVYNTDDTAIQNVRIQNNTIENISSGGEVGASGVKLQGNIENVEVVDNDIVDLQSPGWAYGFVTTPSGADATQRVADVDVVQNMIESVTAEKYEGVGVGIDTAGGDYGINASAEGVIASQNTIQDNDVAILNKDTNKTLDARLNHFGDEAPVVEGAVIYDPVLTTPAENVDGDSREEISEYGSVLELESDGTRALAVGFSAPPDEPADKLFEDINVSGQAFTYEAGEGYQSVEEGFTPTAGEVIVITTGGESIDQDVVVPVDAVPEDESGIPTSVEVENGWNLVATGAADSPDNIDAALGGTGSIVSTQSLQEQPEQPGIAFESRYGAFEGTWVFVDGSGSISTGYGSGQTPGQYAGEVLYPAGQYPDELTDQPDTDDESDD